MYAAVLNQSRMVAFLRGLLGLALVMSFSTPAAAAPRRSELVVSVLTMGPGDPTFSKFGHNAILIKSPQTGHGLVYNFGTFTFSSPTLVSDFLNRRLNYWLSVEPIEETISDYRAQNRTLVEQELALAPEQAEELARALAVNARPENRLYRYDYFLDNCSTRVRDALDRVLGGALKASAGSRATYGFRDHSLRLTADDPLLYLGLDFGLSGYADRPVGEWEEAFLPEKLAALLRRTELRTGDHQQPLVRFERVLFEAKREPPRTEPPSPVLPLAGLGVLFAALAAALGSRRDRAPLRYAYAALLVLCGLVLGGAGSLLAFFWLDTAHEAAWRNLNLLLAPPWALALVVAAPAMARGKRWGERALVALAALSAAGAVVALVLRVTGLALQHDERIIALLLPLWLAFVWVEVDARRSAR